MCLPLSNPVENFRNLQDANPAVAGLVVELFEVRAKENGSPWSGVAAGVVHLIAAMSGARVADLQRIIDEVVADTITVSAAA